MIFRTLTTSIRPRGSVGACFRCFSSFDTGNNVLVEWNGIWWDANVKQVTKDGYVVNITNWVEPWEEKIPASSNRIAAGADDIRHISEAPSSHRDGPKVLPRKPSKGSAESSKTRALPAKSPGREVNSISVNGQNFLTSRLKDGRLVFTDPRTGLLSWSPPLGNKLDTSAKPAQTETQQTLPEGFIERRDLLGNSYFFNPLNGRAQYERPSLPAATVAKNMSSTDGVDAKSIAPWELYFDKDGKPFFHNVESGQSVDELPSTEQTENLSKNVEEPINVIPEAEVLLSEKTRVLEPKTKGKRTNAKKNPKIASDVTEKSDVKESRTVESERAPKTREKGSRIIIDNTPLPEGWEVHYTEDGYPYYFCISTGESHWELPEASSAEEWWVPPSPKSRSASGS